MFQMPGVHKRSKEVYLLVHRLGRLSGQGAPWPTRVSARAASQAFYEVVNFS